MRIALVTEYYFPHLGGVTEHVHNLARRFRSAGHSVTVITSRMRGASVPEDSVCRVGRSVTLFSNGSFARITVGTRLQTELREQLRRDRIDVVHVHGPLAPVLGLAAPAAAHRLGIPVVGTFHSWFKSAAAYRLFRKPLQKRLDRMAATIAVSEPVVRAMSRYFRADWEIIPNGVCLDTFHPNGRPPMDGPLDDPRLLFLGRLDPRNGLDTLIRSMPRVLEAYPKAELIVVGDGPLRGYYQRRARGLGPSVRFVGGAYGERPEYYGNVDLYLCPTTKASFGVTLLESMACGTPMLVSDITGFHELIAGGEEAELVPPDRPSTWAEAMISLLGDPSRRKIMSKAGCEKARAFSWDEVATRVMRVYERAAR